MRERETHRTRRGSGRVLAVGLTALVLVASAGAADLHVPSQYSTIKAAVLAAQNDDTIIIADGVYSGDGFSNVTFGGKRLTVRSANGAQMTSLNAGRNGSVFRLSAMDPAGSVIEGLTLRGASRSAIQIVGTEVTIRDCLITDNWNGVLGGAGIFVDAGGRVTVTDSTLELGLASSGGGILVWQQSEATLIRCTIAGNRVDITGGGGAMADLGSTLVMESCIVRDNQAIGFFGSAAGVRIARDSTGSLVNCLFHGNIASGSGGAISFTNSAAGRVINCTVTGNQSSQPGAGLLLTTGVGNVKVANSILWGNIPDEIAQTGGTLDVSYSIVSGGWPGTGNHGSDPQFVDPFSGDYRPSAPIAINSGDNTALPSYITTDLAGAPRFVNVPSVPGTGVPGGAGGTSIVDMGAYEVQTEGCYPNCDGSTTAPILNVDDFTCFINEYAAASVLPHPQQLTHYANCDGSTIAPALNVDDFTCFINSFAAGCP